MRALSAFIAVSALETAVEASARARRMSSERPGELPLSPIKPGAFARWVAQREPEGIAIRDARRSALRTGIAQRRG
jgi:hypothetical protein